MKITVTLDEEVLVETFADNKVDVHVEALAAAFCALDDDAQAQFFEHIARTMKRWGIKKNLAQLHFVGRHLATCECITDMGRDWLRGLVREIDLATPDEEDP